MFTGASMQCSPGTRRNTGWHLFVSVSLYAYERLIRAWNAKTSLFHHSKGKEKGWGEEGRGETSERHKRRGDVRKTKGWCAPIVLNSRTSGKNMMRLVKLSRRRRSERQMSDQSCFFCSRSACLEKAKTYLIYNIKKLRWEREERATYTVCWLKEKFRSSGDKLVKKTAHRWSFFSVLRFLSPI